MSSLSHAASSAEKRTNARYWIVVMLFIVTSFNYGDRATLSIAGSEMAKDIGLDPVGMGYVFSAFSWAYHFLVCEVRYSCNATRTNRRPRQKRIIIVNVSPFIT
ncbi:hypothetical protein ACTL4V_01925, partial [Salmonella enterica subsp. enterica]